MAEIFWRMSGCNGSPRALIATETCSLNGFLLTGLVVVDEAWYGLNLVHWQHLDHVI